MRLGAFSILFNTTPLETVLDMFSEWGLDCIELGSAGYSRSSHIDVEALYADRAAIPAYGRLFRERGLAISALNAAGNPIHPDPDTAAQHHAGLEKSIVVAAELGVGVVNVLSGVPGGGPGDRVPNWIVSPWPEEFHRAYTYQWEDVLIPYWQRADAFARRHGVRIAVEPHPNFCVYNVESMLKLHAAVGPSLGCNFDPSHFLWQGADPRAAILALGDAIFHCHAKDTGIHRGVVAQNGVLDPKPYSAFRGRAWNFRTCGYGSGEQVWRDIISALAEIDFDGTVSIEHEDALFTQREGMEKAIGLLRGVMARERVETKWWDLRPEG